MPGGGSLASAQIEALSKRFSAWRNAKLMFKLTLEDISTIGSGMQRPECVLTTKSETFSARIVAAATTSLDRMDNARSLGRVAFRMISCPTASLSCPTTISSPPTSQIAAAFGGSNPMGKRAYFSMKLTA